MKPNKNTTELKLPRPRIFITENNTNLAKVIDVFQNVGYIGELRQRWMEIKKLQTAP